MSADPTSADQTWFTWVLGTASIVIAAAIGHIHTRINRAEDQRSQNDDKIWNAMAQQERDANSHRVNVATHMATKDDVRQLREEIRDDIKGVQDALIAAISPNAPSPHRRKPIAGE